MHNRTTENQLLFTSLTDIHKFVFYLLVTCIILLFPVYVYVNRINRTRDEQTAVYPITHHQCQVVKCMLTLTLVAGVFVILGVYFYNYQEWGFFTVTSFIIALFLRIFNVITEVQYLLLSLLSVQRFFLYFIPASDRFINLSPKAMNTVIYLLYGCFGVKEAFFSLWFLKLAGSQKFGGDFEERMAFYNLIKFSLFSTLNLLLLFAAFLYIPIMISIRKFTHLASSLQNQPQKYVLYQTMWIIVGKTFSLLLLLSAFRNERNSHFVLTIMSWDTNNDIFITPLVIQITYLSCNKRNLDMLMKYPVMRALKLILCQVDSHVEPTDQIAVISSTGLNN